MGKLSQNIIFEVMKTTSNPYTDLNLKISNANLIIIFVFLVAHIRIEYLVNIFVVAKLEKFELINEKFTM